MKKRLLSSSPRLFTAEQATGTLPLVSKIVFDLVPLWKSVNSTRKRIQHLCDNREPREGDPYAGELSAMEDRLARDSARIEGFIDELRQVGAEFKGADDCHVCFPAMLDGRLVYLSWQPGELEVSHWVELDGDFAARQTMVAPSMAG